MAERPVPGGDEQQPYTPASPYKRIAAWVGVAYMVIFVLLNFYALMKGDYLRGIGPLLVCPGAAGLAAIGLFGVRGASPLRRLGMGALIFFGGLLFFLGLSDGLPGLIAALGGGR